jgi:hypothetical protein
MELPPSQTCINNAISARRSALFSSLYSAHLLHVIYYFRFMFTSARFPIVCRATQLRHRCQIWHVKPTRLFCDGRHRSCFPTTIATAMLRNGFSVSLRPTVAVLSSCSRGIHTASSARATAFKFTVKHTQLTGGVWRTTFLSSIHSGKGHSVSLPSVFSRGLRTTARTNVAVATGPSQADAWKRFGITAVWGSQSRN